LTFERSVYA